MQGWLQSRKASPPRRKVKPSGPQFLCVLPTAGRLCEKKRKKNRARKVGKPQRGENAKAS